MNRPNYFRVTRIALIFSFVFSLPVASAPKLKVAFFITRQENDRFYRSVVGFMREAAEDLYVDLTVYEANDNHLKMIAQVKEAIKQDFDAFIVVNFKRRGPFIIRMCEEAHIPVFFENSGVIDDAIGAPREQFAYYIGEMVPDDEGGNYNLTRQLIDAAKAASDGYIYVAGIEGQLMTMASDQRVSGFKRAVREYPNVKLTQVVSAAWDFEIAKQKATRLKLRYPKLSVIWTASDGMALGVIDAMKEMKVVPGDELLTGGVDWTENGLNAIRSGEMFASAGANYFEAAWALIVLHDYFHGIDFAESEGVRMQTEMPILTKANIDHYAKALDRTSWDKIDFKNFSKHYNRSLKEYHFGVEAILAELE